ncbi:MAG: DrmE family protein [Negativicutes bacterium]
MEWKEYIQHVLQKKSIFDSMELSIHGETKIVRVPPLIKASISMLENMISMQRCHNIFVFPEKTQSVFIFAVLKSIYNIMVGKIGKIYDPHLFVKGQKLKFKNCVMEFDRIEIVKSSGRELLFVKFTDMRDGLPIEIVPFLQITNTKRLSKYSSFKRVFNIKSAIGNVGNGETDLIQTLQNYKTHLDSSVFYVCPIMNTKEYLYNSSINGKWIHELILLGQIDPYGNIGTLGAGQLAGTPSIVLAVDLYSVQCAISNGASIQSIIVDVSNPNLVASQLDVFDALSKLDIPIVCVTNIADSFDLQCLVDRGYNLWRWYKENLTTDLYDIPGTLSDIKTMHCAKQKIEYAIFDGNEISNSIKQMYVYRKKVSEQAHQMITMFDKLFLLSITALRSIIPCEDPIRNQVHIIISECEQALHRENAFISDEEYEDFFEVILNLKKIYSTKCEFPKVKAVEDYLIKYNYRNVIIVIPDGMDKSINASYWMAFGIRRNLQTSIKVVYPSEYCGISDLFADATIVVGWLNNRIMKKILFSYNTKNYFVLLYDCERRWKDAHMRQWKRALDHENNKTIIDKSFSKINMEIFTTGFPGMEDQGAADDASDELEELELILQDNKYRKYVVVGRQKNAGETVEALPVNFVGGSFAFYRASHKIITATNIIVNDQNKIEMKLPNQLCLDDFIIIRESDHDLVREIADVILENSGKNNCRELAMKWKEALEIETIFSSPEEIYRKLKSVGCEKDLPTVRRWISDNDIISPQHKEDLCYIAQVTEDAVLMEMVDQIFEAGRDVKRAHTKAGMQLSDQLKRQLAAELHTIGEIDPFNIWKPLVLELEGIGTIKILKIIDIGTSMMVDASNTNRLIEEM